MILKSNKTITNCPYSTYNGTVLKRYYKLDVITVLLNKKRYWKVFQTAFLILLAQISPSRHLIYRRNSKTLTEETDSDDYQILHFPSAEECKARLGNVLAHELSLKFSLEEYTANGRFLWLGLKDNIIVSIACTSQAKSANFFF